MSEPKKTPAEIGAEKNSFWKSPAHLLLLIVIFIILLIAAAYVRQNKASAPTLPSKYHSASDTKVYLSSSKISPKKDETVEVSIWEDSGDQAVNAVQVSLTFPTDRLDFVDIDKTGSAFEVEAQNSVDGNKIVLVRGHKGDLTGRQLVAVVSFRAKTSAGQAEIKLDDSTYLVSSASNKDILGQTNGVSLNIGD